MSETLAIIAVLASLVLSGWAIWKLSRGERALRSELDSRNQQIQDLTVELADARRRADEIHAAALEFSEACSAEIPRILQSIEDPVDQRRVARESLRRMLDDAIAQTRAASDRARAQGVVPAEEPAHISSGSKGVGDR